jgi:hypothetical protein
MDLSPVTSVGGRNPNASSNAASIDIVIGIMNIVRFSATCPILN